MTTKYEFLEELKEWISYKKQEYEEEHLNEAINICLYNLERSIEKEIKNKQAIIILYCASGIRSKKGKEILENMGYKNVYSLKHGISGIN